MRCPRLITALAVPALFACVCPGPPGPGGDTAAGTLDTSIAACPPSEAPTLELGWGTDRFTPLGGPLPVEYGPQGGQHLWLAFRSTGLDLSDASTVSVVGVTGNEVVVDQWARLRWTCHEDGRAEVLGLQVPVPSQTLGEQLALDVTVTDADGREVTGKAQILVLE